MSLAIVDKNGTPLNKAQAVPNEESGLGESTMEDLFKLAEAEARKSSTKER